MNFNIGLSFSQLKYSVQIESNDPSMKISHWAIVIDSPTMPTPCIIDIAPDAQLQSVYLTYADTHFNPFADLKLHPMATYTGDLEDFDQVLRHHPMRNKNYSACFNNCQHFAAAFLVFLQALAQSDPNKSFLPAPGYHKLIASVFEGEGEYLWHRPNILLQAVQAMSFHTAMRASDAALAASQATVTLAVPAPGIAGWLGLTINTTAPAWYAGIAAVAAPVCAVVALGIGATYLQKRSEWKLETMFVDPRIRGGFPTGYRPPINANRLDRATGGRGTSLSGQLPPAAILCTPPILF